MREIKFRAWDSDDEVIRDWNNLLSHRYGKKEDSIFNDTDLTIMQFTGLQDSKGKDIYEGDILEFDVFDSGATIRRYFIVEWDALSCGFEATWEHSVNGSGSCGLCSFNIAEENVEIIGNLYEHPELLK